jgi:hypothetical protein
MLQEDEELEAEMGVVLDSSVPQHPLERALQLLEKHDAASAAKLLEHHMGAATSRRRQLGAAGSLHAKGQLRGDDQQQPQPQPVGENRDQDKREQQA